MILPQTHAERAKAAAARRAVDFIDDGMRVGLGTGSTAVWMIRRVAELIRDEGLRITGVPTSTRTAALARELGVPIATLDEAGWLDLTIDGADEVDGHMTLIKGGGGALLQEKIVATASDRMIVIAEAVKCVGTLGAFPLPIEVIPFGWHATRTVVGNVLATQDVDARTIALRQDGTQPFVTDEGNYILDLTLGRIGDAALLAMMLNQVPGVVENGLFVGVCTTLVIGHEDGRVEVRERDGSSMAPEPSEDDNIFADLAE